MFKQKKKKQIINNSAGEAKILLYFSWVQRENDVSAGKCDEKDQKKNKTLQKKLKKKLYKIKVRRIYKLSFSTKNDYFDRFQKLVK